MTKKDVMCGYFADIIGDCEFCPAYNDCIINDLTERQRNIRIKAHAYHWANMIRDKEAERVE